MKNFSPIWSARLCRALDRRGAAGAAQQIEQVDATLTGLGIRLICNHQAFGLVSSIRSTIPPMRARLFGLVDLDPVAKSAARRVVPQDSVQQLEDGGFRLGSRIHKVWRGGPGSAGD